MNPLIACAAYVCGIAGLFYLDRDNSVRTSNALWLPVVYIWAVRSRLTQRVAARLWQLFPDLLFNEGHRLSFACNGLQHRRSRVPDDESSLGLLSSRSYTRHPPCHRNQSTQGPRKTINRVLGLSPRDTLIMGHPERAIGSLSGDEQFDLTGAYRRGRTAQRDSAFDAGSSQSLESPLVVKIRVRVRTCSSIRSKG